MSEQDTTPPSEPISIYEHVAQILQAMATISWQKLGLQPDMMTGKIVQNVPEAKVAIDIAVYLAGVLDSQLDDDDRRRIQGLVRDLRLNYVQKAKELGA